jgi:predicted RNA-binding Zn-ribbon protein involved in translation (DUF1610 family)
MTDPNELATDQNLDTELMVEYNDKPLSSGYWRQDMTLVVLAAIMALSGLGLLLFLGLGIIDVVFGLPSFGVPLLSDFFGWLTSGSRGLVITIGFALIGLIAFVLFRMRALNNLSLYMGADCPNCGEHEFIRVRRRQGDRMVARMGIPVRRYVCRNCSWEGLRIGKALPGTVSEIMPAEILLATGDGRAQTAEFSAEESR